MVQTVIYDVLSNRQPKRLMTHEEHFVEMQGRFAMELIERWGLVAGVPDGEDSAGRQQVRLLGDDELVNRACSIAEKTFEAFAARGWLVKMPDISEIISPDAKD